MIEKVVFIGAGNLATQLALAFTEKGIAVLQVYSHTLENARELAQKVNARFTNELSTLENNADLYVIAVKDSAIEEVLKNMGLKNSSLIVHTAGSIPMEIISGFTKNFGVFYPLQTFSKERACDFSRLPLCIEASDPSTLIKLEKLALSISSSVYKINSEKRKTLHLAAVFVNNFVNHFYTIGAQILQQKELDFDLLKPLIQETANKIQSMHPMDAQTGPAKRNDQVVISDHLKMLEASPELQNIYTFVTQSIFHSHQKQNNDLL